MDKTLVDKILNEIGDKINLLLQRRGSKDFGLYFINVVRDTFQWRLVFGFSPTANRNASYDVTLDFDSYKIFYSLDELTYSESHLGVTEDTPEEERVIKRILAAVWSLHEWFKTMQESARSGSPVGKSVWSRIESTIDRRLHFSSAWNGFGLRIGGVSLKSVE